MGWLKDNPIASNVFAMSAYQGLANVMVSVHVLMFRCSGVRVFWCLVFWHLRSLKTIEGPYWAEFNFSSNSLKTFSGNVDVAVSSSGSGG